MSRRFLRASVRSFTLAVVLASLPSLAHANCGAEGCPIGPPGPDALRGRFSFNVGYRVVEQDRLWDGSHEVSEADAHAGAEIGHEIEQLTRTRSWTLDAGVRLRDDLRLAVAVPYLDRVHRHALVHHANFLIESEWHMKGFGDASAILNWTVPRLSRSNANALVLQAGVKLPTGKAQVEEIDGEQPEPPARPGSGSTDALLGLQYQYPLSVPTLGGVHGTMPITAGVSARLNGRGTDDYRMGNETLANLSAAYPLTRSVRLLAQLNASHHERDDVGLTEAEAHHTGGSVVLAAPGLQASFAPGVTMFGLYQFRLYQHTNGPQLVSPQNVVVGLGFALH